MARSKSKRKINELRSYPSKYPSNVPRHLDDSEWRKARTLELYSYLPQTTLEERGSYIDIRDELVFLNYKFFGFVASNVYLKSSHVSYEDKLQSAVTAFCRNHMWARYKFQDKYRNDLSFSVFFKDRISECVYRDHVTVKHSTNRSLKMKAAQQLGIHWNKLTYEDLSKVELSPNDMASLKAIFYADFEDDIDEVGIYLPAKSSFMGDTTKDLFTDEYDSLEDLLIHEMIEKEKLLDIDDLRDLSQMFDIPLRDLMNVQERAEKMLYKQLSDTVEIQKSFS